MYLFKKNVWTLFTMTFVSAMEGTLSAPSLFLFTESLGGDSTLYGYLGTGFWIACAKTSLRNPSQNFRSSLSTDRC